MVKDLGWWLKGCRFEFYSNACSRIKNNLVVKFLISMWNSKGIEETKLEVGKQHHKINIIEKMINFVPDLLYLHVKSISVHCICRNPITQAHPIWSVSGKGKIAPRCHILLMYKFNKQVRCTWCFCINTIYIFICFNKKKIIPLWFSSISM